MIKIEGLSKRYHDNIVLDNVDLEINEGDVIGIIGPSGTGKSTLLRCIDQLEIPEKGTINLGERDVDLSKRSRKDINEIRQNTGMVFQKFNLFEKKTALENVMEGLIVVKKMRKEEARKIALEELSKVGMTAWANHYPKHMSGGQQQRASIGRALFSKPELLLADEPTCNLDRKNSAEIVELLKESNRKFGQTLILITHDENIALQADRIIYMEDGNITKDDRIRVTDLMGRE